VRASTGLIYGIMANFLSASVQRLFGSRCKRLGVSGLKEKLNLLPKVIIFHVN